MTQFEMRAFPGAGSREETTVVTLRSKSAARAKAGRLAKKVDGPVDIALAGDGAWDERYITTASPSQFHTTGYCVARLT